MPVPKSRHSKSRTRKRRANWKVVPKTFIPCPNCHTLIPPHTVCPNCAHYKGKEVVW